MHSSAPSLADSADHASRLRFLLGFPGLIAYLFLVDTMTTFNDLHDDTLPNRTGPVTRLKKLLFGGCLLEMNLEYIGYRIKIPSSITSYSDIFFIVDLYEEIANNGFPKIWGDTAEYDQATSWFSRIGTIHPFDVRWPERDQHFRVKEALTSIRELVIDPGNYDLPEHSGFISWTDLGAKKMRASIKALRAALENEMEAPRPA